MHGTWIALTVYGGYVPKCRCGWRGMIATSYAMALRSNAMHLRGVDNKRASEVS